MLSHVQIEKVDKLLTTGKHSERAISKLTGVARTVIHRLVEGKRKKRLREHHQWDEHWHGLRSPIPDKRCPKCGAMVQMPCLVCIMRELAAKDGFQENRLNRENQLNGEDMFALKLTPEQHKRYVQVRNWRAAQKDPHFTEIPEDWPFRRRPPNSGKLKAES